LPKKKPRAVLSNRLYLPSRFVSETHKSQFRYAIGDDEDPLIVENWQDFGDYYGFCRGNLTKVRKTFRRFAFKDRRAFVPLPEKYTPTFTGIEGNGFQDLRKDQKQCLAEWIHAGYGLVEAPPRWGKTVWAAAVLCLLKQRTLFMAHTTDLLDQLLEEVYDWTDLRDLERFHGRKLAGWLKNWSDDYPVLTVSTWQKFHQGTDGKEHLRRLRDQFGIVGLDEAHKVKAQCYTGVYNVFNPYYRVGMTATPYLTKSQLHVICHDVIGPVTTVGPDDQMPAVVTLVRTPMHVPRIQDWGTMWTKQSQHESRNKFIRDMILRDVKSGRACLVVTERVKHCYVLRDLLVEKDPHLVVEVIEGSVQATRKDIRTRAKRGEVDVIIAMSRIIQLGFNVPVLSALHNLMPLTDPENWYQRSSRVRTRMQKQDLANITVKRYKKKPMPVIRAYYDTGYARATMAYVNMVKWKSDELGIQVRDYSKKTKRR
jgi:superfamily II DNA or RNA helicase